MRPGVRDRPLWRGRDRERREGLRRGHGQYPRVQGRPGCAPSPSALPLRRGGARRRRKAPIEREQKGLVRLSLTRKVDITHINQSTIYNGSHQQLATPSTIMAGSPSTANELPYSSRDVDGGCRDIDRQSLRIRDRSIICTHAGWDYERRTDIIDTAENLLSKLIFPLC